MIDKAEIRDVLLKQLDSSQCDEDIFVQLENLTVFNPDNELDMDIFYTELNKIISLEDINSIQYSTDEVLLNQNTKKILNVLCGALKIWKTGVKDANLNKVLVSFIVTKRLLLQPEKDLSWDGSFEKLKECLAKILSKIKCGVSDELSERAKYSDKKFHSDYKKAIENNDYKGIFAFFNAVERGGGIDNINSEFIEAIARIASKINPQLIAINIGNYSPILMKQIIGCMNKNQIIKMLRKYQGESILPLLIGLVNIVNSIRHNSVHTEILSNFKFIKNVAAIVLKISEKVNNHALFSYISEIGNISSNKLWHATYLTYLVGKPEYYEDYINNIDFSDGSGEIAYKTLVYFGDDSDIDGISKRIYYRFFDYLNNSNHQQHLFTFTSYYKFIFRAIHVLSKKSFSKYLSELEQVSIELLRGIYSWQFKKYMLFSKWIYWLLASKQIEHDSEINKSELKCTYRLLEDSRVVNLLKTNRLKVEISFDSLIDFLDSPESVSEFALPRGNGAIKMQWTED